MNDDPADFQSEFTHRQTYYRSVLQGPLEKPSLELLTILGTASFKAIAVYPEAVMWEPQQRPQHLLRELANRGYLCFFCEASRSEFGIREIEPNLFLVHGEAYLLSALRSQAVIVLCSWMMQMAWAELLPHRIMWFDILDSPDLFSYHDARMIDKQRQVLRMADIVTYSSRRLKIHAAGREDALYLPNAADLDHFRGVPDSVPADLEPIVSSDSKIVGYFGAMEEWLDADLIEEIAKRRPKWKFVFIGTNGLPEGRLSAANIYLLGPKMYKQIRDYGHCFDVAIIPFKVNDMTNCVSPVKFFEYAAMGLPVVSTPIAEMIPFRSKWVRIADGADEFERAIRRCVKPETKQLAEASGSSFASKERWKDRVDEAERILAARPNAWKAYANYNPSGKVAVMATTFFDFDGERFYSGGAERYLIDLGRLCRRIGLRFIIYQYGNYAWIRRYQHIDVISLSRGGQHAKQFTVAAVKMFARLFRELTEGRSALSIYSAYFNAWPHGIEGPAIGIIHGVCWDGPSSRFGEGTRFWEQNRRFIEGAHLCGELVSVDTNSANWFQTVDYELGRRIKVIPNYVDEQVFTPRPDYSSAGERMTILYPRRLYKPRGLYMVLDIADRILGDYPQVDIHFVGNGEAEDKVPIEAKIRKWGGRIKLYSLPMSEMAQAYREADITLIPTLYSEGTSLSCLEAMACGNAVVATRIGGLSDLVIHNYNGLLIEPNAEALETAIRELIDDPAKLASLKRRAVDVAGAFSKGSWEERWLDVIRKSLGTRPADDKLTSLGTRPADDKLKSLGARSADDKLTSLSTHQAGDQPQVRGILSADGKGQGNLAADGKPESAAAAGRLVEIHLAEIPQPGDRHGGAIIDFLSQGDLVYLRIKGCRHPQPRAQSFGRLQWLDGETPRFSEPDLVIADLSMQAELNGRLDAILNKEGKLEWISSSRPSPTAPDRP